MVADGSRVIYANESDLYSAKPDGSDKRKIHCARARVVATGFTGWTPRAVLGVRSAYHSEFPVGSFDGWNPRPPSPARFERDQLLLWQLDSGRKLLRLSVSQQRPDRHLGHPQKGIISKIGSSEPVRLTTGPLNYWSPLPSKDGKKIFVVGEQPHGEILRYDTKLDQFVPFMNGLSAEQVRFSPDGQWATYMTYPENILWRSKMDGSERLQLTFSPYVRRFRGGRRMGKKLSSLPAARAAVQNIRHFCRRGSQSRDNSSGTGAERSGLVRGRKFHHFWRVTDQPVGSSAHQRHSYYGFENTCGLHYSRD